MEEVKYFWLLKRCMWLVLYMNLKECSKIYGVLFLNCMFLLDVIGYSLKMDYEDMILELIFEI